MKLKSITIRGMHKVDNKTYLINDGVTYFVGPNGAGKSTILEAIQLALLGYIPGYAKKNESIMKHSSDKMMEVTASFDDGGFVIDRTWMKKGASASCEVDKEAAEAMTTFLGEAALPIFDFNEFKSMTANKLKEWFIEFLPDVEGSNDLLALLMEELGEREIILSDELKNSIISWLETNKETGVERVKSLNAFLKEYLSYTKGQIEGALQSLKSLIRYDDLPDDLDAKEIAKRLQHLSIEKTESVQASSQKAMQERVAAQIAELEAKLPASDLAADARVAAYEQEIIDLTGQLDKAINQYKELVPQKLALQNELSSVPRSSDTCPFTNKFCEEAAKLFEDSVAKSKELSDQIAKLDEQIAICDITIQSDLGNQIHKIQNEVQSIKLEYEQLNRLRLEVIDVIAEGRPVIKIDADIAEAQDLLAKAKANEAYDKLIEKVTNEKFARQNDLEVLKMWVKYTDANGLQTEMMQKPFENLADGMSDYLTKMFNEPTKALFNLTTKANSFSFGLERNGNYIEFDYLSSGERCLFTLALMMCILDRSNSQIKTILIDDILDHLDDENASHLFSALKSIEGIQFILAGVKKCDDETICKAV